MDARRFLILTTSTVALTACATPKFPAGPSADGAVTVAPSAPDTVASVEIPEPEPAEGVAVEVSVIPETPVPTLASVPAAEPKPESAATPAAAIRSGRRAIADANQRARVASASDAFVGGVQIFAWSPGRVYEVWTAPLRVTTLTLAEGETLRAKAAGDTVRWQIGESRSGEGATGRTHVLIKPLQTGLETNLVLTTSQRVYLIQLRSGAADAFNAAVAWDDQAVAAAAAPPILEPAPPTPPIEAVQPQGPIDARYRIRPMGRPPRWTPVSVFNDGIRTFVVFGPEARTDELPALLVRSAGALQLVNYRQSGDTLIVDRLFDDAELRLGDRRPVVVRLTRLGSRR